MDPQVAQAFVGVNKILKDGGCKHFYLGHEKHLILLVKENAAVVFSDWPEHGFDNLIQMTKDEAIMAASKIEQEKSRESVLRELRELK